MGHHSPFPVWVNLLLSQNGGHNPRDLYRCSVLRLPIRNSAPLVECRQSSRTSSQPGFRFSPIHAPSLVYVDALLIRLTRNES